ncbi:MAG TPA: hypothetical protein VGG38_16625 [Acidimicrobiales bacterium]
MTHGIVLDPTATARKEGHSAGPPLGQLGGKVIGMRRDFWLSWDVVTDEWARMLTEAGASVKFWHHQPPVGKQAEAVLASYNSFLTETDATIAGLCNCGACTMWTIHDALLSLERDHPTIVCTTEHFRELAISLAGQGGRQEIRMQVLPYPLQGRADDDVRQVARDTFPSLLEAFGAVV